MEIGPNDPLPPDPWPCVSNLGMGSDKSGVGILSINGDGEGGSSSGASHGWDKHSLTVGRFLKNIEKSEIYVTILKVRLTLNREPNTRI